jgi:hypothetical protein
MYLGLGWIIILGIVVYAIAYSHGHNNGSSRGYLVGYEKGKTDGYGEGKLEGEQSARYMATSATPEVAEDPKKQQLEVKRQRLENRRQLALLERDLPDALMSEQGLSAKAAVLEARKMVEDLKTDIENNGDGFGGSWRLESSVKWLANAKKEKVLKARYGERLEAAKKYISKHEFIANSFVVGGDKDKMKDAVGVGSAGVDWIISRLVRERKLEPLKKREQSYDGSDSEVLTGWAVMDKVYEKAKEHILSEGQFTHSSLCDFLRKSCNIDRTGIVAQDIASRLEKEGIITPVDKDNEDYSLVREVLTS